MGITGHFSKFYTCYTPGTGTHYASLYEVHGEEKKVRLGIRTQIGTQNLVEKMLRSEANCGNSPNSRDTKENSGRGAKSERAMNAKHEHGGTD